MSKGDAEHAAQHQHGVIPRTEPPAPRTIEQRVAELEKRAGVFELDFLDKFSDLESRVEKLAALPEAAEPLPEAAEPLPE